MPTNRNPKLSHESYFNITAKRFRNLLFLAAALDNYNKSKLNKQFTNTHDFRGRAFHKGLRHNNNKSKVLLDMIFGYITEYLQKTKRTMGAAKKKIPKTKQRILGSLQRV